MGAVGLKTYIWNNNLKSLLLLAGFPVLLIGMVYALELLAMGWGLLPSTHSFGGNMAYAASMLWSFVPLAVLASLVWFVIAYFSYQTIIDLSTGAHPVERKDAPQLYNMLENLAISRGMKTPTLRIVETDAMNAFASGLREGQYSVTVTTGLLDTLDERELESVLAHEMTHVINRDVRLMVIASIFVGIITLLAQVIVRSIFWVGGGGGRSRSSGKGGGAGLFLLIAFAIAAVGYVLAIVVRMAISRKREFIADAGAVELTKDPDAMISALQKISGHSEIHAPESIRAMFLDDHHEGVMGLFSTHPPIQARIDALVRFAGGRVMDQVAPAVPETPPAPAPSMAQPQAEPPAAPTAAPPASGPWG
jgi:heat shock protein HtpX